MNRPFYTPAPVAVAAPLTGPSGLASKLMWELRRAGFACTWAPAATNGEAERVDVVTPGTPGRVFLSVGPASFVAVWAPEKGDTVSSPNFGRAVVEAPRAVRIVVAEAAKAGRPARAARAPQVSGVAYALAADAARRNAPNPGLVKARRRAAEKAAHTNTPAGRRAFALAAVAHLRETGNVGSALGLLRALKVDWAAGRF